MITLVIILLVTVLCYYYSTRTFKYWELRGVKYDKPFPLLGNNVKNFTMQQSLIERSTEMYNKYPEERIVGYFWATRPLMVVRDPDIVKRILTTDFLFFYSRGLNYHEDAIEPLFRNLFFADGDMWRLLRQRMTPAFSSGKLKAMFPLVCARAERLQAILYEAVNQEAKTLDAHDLVARYTTDFIGSVGFGLDTDSLADENSSFRRLGKKFFNSPIIEDIISVLKEIFPDLCKHLKMTLSIESEVISLVTAILNQRNYEPSGRNDFIDLLLECKKQGTIVTESIEKTKANGKPELATLEMDDQLIAAQVFIFFAAGFETSSSTSSFTLHQLAYHPEVQTKVQEEIDRVLLKYNNKLCYEAIKEMKYLECAFKEAMRIFPSVGCLMRRCTRKYTIPEIDVTIDPGVIVWIPVQAMQNDPQNFEAPHVFRPERFFPNQLEEKNKYVYLPFGEGPRACIGMRLGMMQSIAGLAAILSKFSVEPGPSTIRNPAVDPKSNIVQIVKGGLPLVFRERTNAA